MKNFPLKIIVFLCGATVMAFEIIGARILGVYVGTSIFVWTSIIGIILASLSLGYWLGGRIADRKPTYRMLTLIILLAGISIVLTNYGKEILLDYLSGQIKNVKSVSIISSFSLFGIPAVLLGMVSPYAVRLEMNNLNNTGSTVGNLYALSTVGSIVGTFLAGFYLIPNFRVSIIMFILGGVLLCKFLIWAFLVF